MKKTMQVPAGLAQVDLAQKEGSLVRRALLCRTGVFNGMFGEVRVDVQMLERIKIHYTNQKQNPTNENDYAPILLDHNRSVDLVKGRLLAEGLEIAEWREVDGVMQFGLFGNLRIDDVEAIKNVESGKYAHLSISFDEETGELFEVSFVAVEAARGSIILSKGEKMDKKKLVQLSQRHTALKTALKQSRSARKTALSALLKTKSGLDKDLKELMTKAQSIALSVKTGQIKGRFSEFIREGKMNPAELKAMDFTSLAGLNEQALGLVLKSYENRPVMEDVYQYGQEGDTTVEADLSPAAMREAIKLQREGKKAITLAEGDAPTKEDKKDMSSEGEEKEKMKMYSMDEAEYSKCLEDVAGVHSKLSEVVEKLKAMGDKVDEMSKDEEKAESEEKLAADEEKVDMADDEDDEKKKKLAEGEDDKNKDKKEGEE